MRQTIRALGWAVKILWIVALLLPITVALSLVELYGSKAVGIEEPTVSFSNGKVFLSAPFYINNTGFYDLSDINITILVGSNNKSIASFSRLFPTLPAKSLLNATYDLSFSLEELDSANRDLLTHDSNLDLAMSTFLRVAYAIGLGIFLNTTTEWGAPLHNLTVSDIAYNVASQEFSLSLSFENHAYFPTSGALLVEAVNAMGERIGSATQYLNVASGTPFQLDLTIPIDSSKMIGPGVFRVYFLDLLVSEVEWS